MSGVVWGVLMTQHQSADYDSDSSEEFVHDGTRSDTIETVNSDGTPIIEQDLNGFSISIRVHPLNRTYKVSPGDKITYKGQTYAQ